MSGRRGGRGWGRGGRRGRGRGGRGRGGRSQPSQVPDTPPSQFASSPSSARAPLLVGSDAEEPIVGWARYFPGEDYSTFTSHEQLEQFRYLSPLIPPVLLLLLLIFGLECQPSTVSFHCRQFFDVRATMLTKQEARPSLAIYVDYTKLIESPEFIPAGGGQSEIALDIRDEVCHLVTIRLFPVPPSGQPPWTQNSWLTHSSSGGSRIGCFG